MSCRLRVSPYWLRVHSITGPTQRLLLLLLLLLLTTMESELTLKFDHVLASIENDGPGHGHQN